MLIKGYSEYKSDWTDTKQGDTVIHILEDFECTVLENYSWGNCDMIAVYIHHWIQSL